MSEVPLGNVITVGLAQGISDALVVRVNDSWVALGSRGARVLAEQLNTLAAHLEAAERERDAELVP